MYWIPTMLSSSLFWMCLICLSRYNIHVVEACPCSPERPHPQQQFCSSDFVFKTAVQAKIYDGSAPNRTIKYTVTVQKSFKGGLEVNSQVELNSVENVVSCGVQLVSDVEYLVSGTSFQHKLISSCDWISEWNNLSQFQQDSLNNDIYSGTCYSGCEIVIPPENTLHGCVMDSQNSCFDLNAVCNVDLSTGDCQWTDCI